MMTRLCLALAVTLFSHNPASAQPIPGLSEDQTLLVIVAAVLLLGFAVGGWNIYSGLQNRKRAKASALWPTAGGTVTASEVHERVSRDRKKGTVTYFYTPHVRYTYRVLGADYENDTIRFGDLEKTNGRFADELVAKYPTGAAVAVHYDPQDPKRATLETISAGGSQIWGGLFFIVVPLIIGIVFFLLAGHKPELPPEVLEHLNRPN